MKKIMVAILGITLLAVPFLVPRASGQQVELYYSRTCGCCVEYGKYLESKGYDVIYKETPNMEAVKNAAGIPENLWSCHTAKIGEYVVEGHVPVEVIERIMDDGFKTQIIALPGMPSGSPGMPGPKTTPFDIYTVEDGEIKKVMSV